MPPPVAAPRRLEGSELSWNQTLDAVCSFLKVATHTILCQRGLYPPSVFTRKQRYRVPVWASRHPGLNEYIDEVVRAVRIQMDRRAVQSVHLVVTSRRDGAILERYRFDVDFLVPVILPRDKDLAIPKNVTLQALELHLRAFMQKLIALDGALDDLQEPEDASWALVLDILPGARPETADTSGNEPPEGPWVPFSATRHDEAGTEARGSRDLQPPDDDDAAVILPVKSLDTGVINLMLYVEEHPASKQHQSPSASQSQPQAPRAYRRPSQPSLGGDTTTDRPTQGNLTAANLLRANEAERDLDAPQATAPRATSAAARNSRKLKQRKAGDGGQGEEVEGSERSVSEDERSDDSVRSVGDFAGFGGAGGTGMGGMRM